MPKVPLGAVLFFVLCNRRYVTCVKRQRVALLKLDTAIGCTKSRGERNRSACTATSKRKVREIK
nr:MAG TPA: hypothetical protein [Caudoviricetes sp.]